MAAVINPIFAIESEVKFQHMSWKDALDKGKAEHKPVYIDAYAPWCGPCNLMAMTTFTDSAVAAYMNDKFILVKVNTDTEEGEEFSAAYGVEFLPTSFFFDENGDQKIKESGFKDSESFLSLAKRMFGEDPIFNELAELEKKMEAGDSSLALLTVVMMKKIEADSYEGLTQISNAILRQSEPAALVNDTIFFAYYLTEQAYDDPYSVYLRNNFAVISEGQDVLTYNKALEVIITGLQEAAVAGDKKKRDEIATLYLSINPEGSKKEVKKIYRNFRKDLKKNKATN